MNHVITKSIVRSDVGGTLRARCSCGTFDSYAARRSTAARNKQDRLINRHLGQVLIEHESPLALQAAE